jgi:LacI family transcriptional regulator
MRGYVTLAEVAAAAGVSVTTVSLALRGHPRISAATRTRIEGIAAGLGYRPNPMLSSLAAYRQQVRGPAYQATVAVISNHPPGERWRREQHHQQAFVEGARARGQALGFELEEFWLREPGMSAERLSRVLEARNISGLLLLPQPRARGHLNLAWEHFSPVAFGYSLSRPRLHVAAANHFQAGMTVVRRLRSLGYRRIGFVALPEVIERLNRAVLGGFLAELDRREPAARLPTLTMPRAELARGPFERWFREHRPDALFFHGLWPDLVLGWLEEMRVEVPAEVGVAFSSVDWPASRVAGMDENVRLLGAKALELVKAMIDRGEKGIPEIPLRLMVEGTWREGGTVRRVNGGVEASDQN